MKKVTRTLRLDQQTVRVLHDPKLARVVGAGKNTKNDTICTLDASGCFPPTSGCTGLYCTLDG
jgi:hypothetical protein